MHFVSVTKKELETFPMQLLSFKSDKKKSFLENLFQVKNFKRQNHPFSYVILSPSPSLGTLTVNVSVLLLSLASPDESSLVSFSIRFAKASAFSHKCLLMKIYC